MIPKNISLKHVLAAIEDYENNGIRWPLAKIKTYSIVYKKKFYPPIYIVCLANEFVNGDILPYTETNTNESHKFLLSLSRQFSIHDNEKVQPRKATVRTKVKTLPKVVGAFVFRDEGDGCLLAKYVEHSQLTPYTESAKMVAGGSSKVPFEGNYDTTWIEETAPRFQTGTI